MNLAFFLRHVNVILSAVRNLKTHRHNPENLVMLGRFDDNLVQSVMIGPNGPL